MNKKNLVAPQFGYGWTVEDWNRVQKQIREAREKAYKEWYGERTKAIYVVRSEGL